MTQIHANAQPLGRFDGPDALARAKARAAERAGSEVLLKQQDPRTGKEFYTLHTASENQLREYQSAELDPNQVLFSLDQGEGSQVVSPGGLVCQSVLADLPAARSLIAPFTRNDHAGAPAVPAEMRPRLDSLAKVLGFEDFTVMQYQMRNLPPAQVDALFSSLRDDLGTLDPQSVTPADVKTKVDTLFAAQMQQQVRDLFTQARPPLRPPEFSVSDTNRSANTRWNGSAVLAIFNAISELKGQDRSGRMLQLLSDNNGNPNPLVFERASQRELGHYGGDDGHISLMDMLTSSMEVSYVNTAQGKVVLHDAGVSGQEAGILRDAILARVDVINRPDPVYLPAELTQRNRELAGEGLSLGTPQQARRALKQEYLQRYGLESLYNATNFVLGYRGREAQKLPYDNAQLKAMLQDPQKKEQLQQELFKVLDDLNISRLQEVAFKTEQVDAVRSLQEMLNMSRPENQHLQADGIYGDDTSQAVRRFQLEQVMNLLKESVEDDPRLSLAAKREFMGEMRHLFDHLAAGESPEEIAKEFKATMSNLLAKPSGQLAPTTRTLLTNGLREMDDRINGRFGRETVRMLIDNWIDIMDTGKGADFTEQLMAHELAHTLQEQPGIMDNWRQISWQEQNFELKNSMGVTLIADRHDHLHDHGGFASDYARVNEHEDFAESVRVFTYQPERLLQHSLVKFMFMNSLLNTYNADQIIDMAKQAGYGETQLKDTLRAILGHAPPPGQEEVEAVRDMSMAMLSELNPVNATMAQPHQHTLRGTTQGIQAAMRFSPERATSMAASVAPRLLNNAEPLQLPPSSPGWVLEYLTQQYQTTAGAALTADKEQAQARITAFLAQGLEALPAEARTQIPPDVRARLSSEEGRAVYAATAQLLGSSRALTQLTQIQQSDQADYARGGWLNDMRQSVVTQYPQLDPEGSQITRLNQSLDGIRQNPESLRRLVGDEVYHKLPPVFLAMISEDNFVNAVTGNRGDAVLSPTLVAEHVFHQLETRTEASAGLSVTSAIQVAVQTVAAILGGSESPDLAVAATAGSTLTNGTIANMNQGLVNKVQPIDTATFQEAIADARTGAASDTGTVDAERFVALLQQKLEQFFNAGQTSQ